MFIVLEVQANIDGTVGTLINTYKDTEKSMAESKYHTILSAAAISNVYNHAAFMLTDEGRLIRSERYRHESPAETEPEPESEA